MSTAASMSAVEIVVGRMLVQQLRRSRGRCSSPAACCCSTLSLCLSVSVACERNNEGVDRTRASFASLLFV